MGRKEDAYNYIKEAIFTNRLVQGEPVREEEISAALGISRTPVREAFRMLEAEGTLVSYPSRGTFVSVITPYDVEEIFELRTILECSALKKSIYRITDQELDTALEKFAAAKEDGGWESHLVADSYLHGLIVEKSGSKRLKGFVNNLNTQVQRIRSISAVGDARRDASYQEHMDIIQAIRERDLEKCTAALGYHLRLVAKAAIENAEIMGAS